jgi:DNA-binding NarL/FixJ family response regulator
MNRPSARNDIFPDQSLSMSVHERARVILLIIEPDASERHNMRTTAKSLGYGGVSDAPNHAAAFDKLEQRKFTHVIFSAKKTNIEPKEFLDQLLKADEDITAIPSSFEPNIDDVFTLLIMGAKGYLVKPFTADAIDQAVIMATKGEPIADVVLQAKDRNEALVAIMMSSLDRAATTIRQAEQFETAKREIPKMILGMKRSAELAKTFAKNGSEGLLVALEKFCIERGQGPATRLGRLRKKLRTGRKPNAEGEGEGVDDPQAPTVT